MAPARFFVVTAGDGPILDSAMVFVSVEERRALAVLEVVQVDQRPAIGTFLIEAFFFGLSPKSLERFGPATDRPPHGLHRGC